MPGVKGLVYDTTGVGYFEPSQDAPSLQQLNAAIRKAGHTRVKLTGLTEVELQKPAAAYRVDIKGLG